MKSFTSICLTILLCTQTTVQNDAEVIDMTTDAFQVDCLLSHNKLRDDHCSHQLKFSRKVSCT